MFYRVNRLFVVMLFAILPITLLAQEAQEKELSSDQIKLTRSVSKSVLTARVKEKQRVKAETSTLRKHLEALKTEINELDALEGMPEISAIDVQAIQVSPASNNSSPQKPKQNSKAAQRNAEKQAKRVQKLSKSKDSLSKSKTETNRLLAKSKGNEKDRYQKLLARLNTLEGDLNDYENASDDEVRQRKIKAIHSRIASKEGENTSKKKASPRPEIQPTFSTITKHK